MAKKIFRKSYDFNKLANKLSKIMANNINVHARNINKAIQDNTSAGIGINDNGEDERFKPLKPSTVSIHGDSTPPLNRTGKMKQTRITPATSSKLRAIIRMRTFYGAFHNTGYKNPKMPTKNWVPGAKIEKRQWFAVHNKAAPGGIQWKKAMLEIHLRLKTAWKK